MIKVISTRNEFIDIKQEWLDLYSSLDYVTPFQSFEFNYNLWITFEGEEILNIVCIYRKSDKKLRAIFPCIIDKKGVLKFINHIYTDFCMPMIDPIVYKDYYLYKEFAEYIKSNGSIKGFMFDNLREDCYLNGILGYFFKGMQTRISNRWTCFKLNNKDSGYKDFIGSLSQLTPKDRYKIKNIITKLPTPEFILYNINNSIFPKQIISEILQSMFDSGLRSEAYFTNDVMSFLERLYDSGVITLGCTFAKDKPLACNIYVINKEEYIDWLAIYTDKRYNTANLLQMMEMIYNTTGGTFNFARGLYDYKVSNFKPEIHNLYRIEYSKRRLGQINILFSFCIFYLKEFLKPILKK